MARKKKSGGGGGPGAPLWMSTYGDMVTLLLCFFVLLYAFSTLDVQKFTALTESLQNAFNIQPGGRTDSKSLGLDGGMTRQGAGDAPKATASDQVENSRQVLALMQETIKNEHLEDEITIEVTERGVVISFSEQFLFDEGSARIHPDALRILFKIGNVVKSLPNMVSLEGNTDSARLQDSIYGDNWGLSAARAAVVASYLNNSLGIPANRLKAVGLGPSSPLVPNDSAEHMAINRRVDMVILSQHSIH
ncbi:MAG: OmpA family protein [Synergistaceae bacterium]|jgi:chemotaxis protein MotB|nr:OmpA family protein [Synergistaceae bacterium]